MQLRIPFGQKERSVEAPAAVVPGLRFLRRETVARWALRWLALAILCAAGAGGASLAWGAGQAVVSPDSTPAITSVQPSQAAPGTKVTLTIEGERFAPGAYVSFSDPAIHILATRRVSDKRLEVEVAVGIKAPAELANLYVANPAGTSAQSTFAIASRAPTAAQTPMSVSPTASPAPAGPIEAGAAAPQVSKVDPAHVAAGSKASIKVTGKKFVKGAKIAFQNPGIRVLGTDFKKSTQLVAKIEVAPNAPAGKTSLFVVNPDESEVETSFEVIAAETSSSGSNSKKAASGSTANTVTQTFSVINLGDAISILQDPNKPRGSLILSGGKLTYQEGGKDVFVVGPGAVKEVAPNILFGFNTSTFHVILNSGKTYNFVASSLVPSETAAIIAALQKAFPQ